MATEKPTEVTRRYFLSAGETDAEGRMPMALIFERAIEIATEHANILGIGYARLIQAGVGWVLTRMSVRMLCYPGINEHYSITTWIEGYNRLYSDRCFLICDAEGREIGHLRSMWVAIDMAKRTAADLSQFEVESFPVSERKCPVPMQRKLPPLSRIDDRWQYTFRFSDIDFNRHVNTVQYVRLLLNNWSVPFFDDNQIAEMQIAFHQECVYGETVEFRAEDVEPGIVHCELAKGGQRAVAATLRFEPRQKPADQN